MRLSELEQTTGVPAATIKYYLREGLLHPGRAVAARLSEYDGTHVRRLRLLRVLREVGDVPVSRLQLLAQAVEDERSLHQLLGTAADLLSPEPPEVSAEHRRAADTVIEEAGWRVRAASRDRGNLAAALATYESFTGRPLPAAALAPYLRAAEEIAAREIAGLDPSGGRAELLEQMVVGQVVFGHLLEVLRRLAEEHHSAVRFS